MSSENGNAMRTPRVAIIGAGMSGIGMAAKLKACGIESFDIYEMASALGGTWQANTYPGLSCDVPSRYYCYTFAPNPDWTHVNSAGAEIHRYLDRVAEELEIKGRIRFDSEVEVAEWEEGRWRLRTKDGHEGTYDWIVSACGGLVRVRKPAIPGLESFDGPCFHSAEWDHSAELDGKRIAVIGTGSTGMQITRALGSRAGRYEWYQRTPQWIIPIPNRRYSRLSRWALRRFPALNRISYEVWRVLFEQTFGYATIKPGLRRRLIELACRLHLYRIRDPELRRRMTPTDRPMCKRLIMGNGIYPVLERDNVAVVDVGIERIEPRGIVTRDGELHRQDVIVLATGFDAHAFVRPMELVGPGGLRLSEAWSGEPYSYKTVAMPGFPNFMMLIGPRSPFGNQSLFSISETQADYVLKCIDLWRRGEVEAMSPRPDATESFNAEIRAALPDTAWASGCQSWYIGKDGLPSAWPFTPARHREVLAEPELDEWELTRG